MRFSVDDVQRDKLAVWVAEQDEIVRLRQVSSSDAFTRACARTGAAYYGAIGGALTYCFTPNSIGEVLTVKHAGTDAEIDLTDYDCW